MLELQQLQQRLQIRKVEFAFHVAGRGRRQVAILGEWLPVPGRGQVLVQVRFLLRQAETQPLRENLVVAVAQDPVRVFRPQEGQQGLVAIAAGPGIPQRRQEGQPCENRRNLRQRVAPNYGARRANSRICRVLRQNAISFGFR